MNEKLRKIINHYGMDKQLKYFQSEVFELNEAIIKRRNTGVIESIAIGITNAVAPLLNIKNAEKELAMQIKDYMSTHDIPLETPLQLLKYIPKENVDENQMKINFETGEVEQNG